MSAAADARGLKRVCVECGIRFYDLIMRPIIWPNCSADFTGVEKVKSRRSRSAKPPDAGAEGQVSEKTAKNAANDDEAEDEDLDEEDDVEIVSLDDDDAVPKGGESDDEDDIKAVALDDDEDDDGNVSN